MGRTYSLGAAGKTCHVVERDMLTRVGPGKRRVRYLDYSECQLTPLHKALVLAYWAGL